MQQTVCYNLNGSTARIAQSVERKTLNLVVQGYLTSCGPCEKPMLEMRAPLFGRPFAALHARLAKADTQRYKLGRTEHRRRRKTRLGGAKGAQ